MPSNRFWLEIWLGENFKLLKNDGNDTLISKRNTFFRVKISLKPIKYFLRNLNLGAIRNRQSIIHCAC